MNYLKYICKSSVRSLSYGTHVYAKAAKLKVSDSFRKRFGYKNNIQDSRILVIPAATYSGTPGKGSGGVDGTIKSAGGKFGEMAAAKEDQFFYQQNKQALKDIAEKKKEHGKKISQKEEDDKPPTSD